MPRSLINRHWRLSWRHLAALVALFLIPLAAMLALRSPTASSQAQFADTAFRAMWERTDGPVAARATERGWVWGPVPGRTLNEPFGGIPGDSHLVQYFDKGRMEINNPNGNKNDPFYVTNGLLSEELISGLQQTGVTTYTYRGPASLNLASDSDDLSAPTYQSFNGVSNIAGAPNERRAASAVGQTVRTAIDRQGITQPWPDNHSDYGVRIAYFEQITGHNIPDVFWAYLNSQGKIIQNGQQVSGPLFFPIFSVTGYPISEPYWSYVKVEGQYTDVMIQAYERRVLTFVPHFQVGYKVQMGNIGQHYYDWRYNNLGGGGGGGQTQPTPTSVALPPKPNLRIDGISYRKSIVDLNGNYVIITNPGQTPVSFDGWWLDSPKWDHVDRFYFPKGTVLGAGASVRVHAGQGQSTTIDIYMFRTSAMWDNAPYDLALLYDNYGREVVRFFPAAETGPPPTQPPAPTATPAAGQPTPTTKEEQTATPTPIPGAPTATVRPPSPVATSSPAAVSSATKTPAPGGLRR